MERSHRGGDEDWQPEKKVGAYPVSTWIETAGFSRPGGGNASIDDTTVMPTPGSVRCRFGGRRDSLIIESAGPRRNCLRATSAFVRALSGLRPTDTLAIFQVPKIRLFALCLLNALAGELKGGPG